jgi:hypothetical protein
MFVTQQWGVCRKNRTLHHLKVWSQFMLYTVNNQQMKIKAASRL